MEEKGVVDKFIEASGVDWERLTKFRRNMHEYPEGGFQEVETGKKVLAHLKAIGIKENDELITVRKLDETKEVFLATKMGKAINRKRKS